MDIDVADPMQTRDDEYDIDFSDFDLGEDQPLEDRQSKAPADHFQEDSGMLSALDGIQIGETESRTDGGRQDLVAEIKAKVLADEGKKRFEAANKSQIGIDAWNAAAAADTSKGTRPCSSPIASNENTTTASGQAAPLPTGDVSVRTKPAGYGDPTWNLKHNRPNEYHDKGAQKKLSRSWMVVSVRHLGWRATLWPLLVSQELV